jgi:hypothetical protein
MAPVGTRLLLCVFLVSLSAVCCITAPADDDLDQLKVGVQPDGRIVVPTNQILKPAGKQLTFPGRPVDLAFAEDGKTLVVKNMRDLVFIDVATKAIKQTLPSPKQGRTGRGPGFSAVGRLVQGKRDYVTDALNHVCVAESDGDGQWH